jgi:hypothetical protein
MKKLFIPAALLFLCFCFLLVSCDKGTKEPTTEELLMKLPWKFSKATANTTDVSAFVTPCNKDNLITFLTGSAGVKTGKLNEGATKCNATDPDNIDFVWTYDANFNKLKITPPTGTTLPLLPGGSNEFTLVRISVTELVLSQNITFLGTTQLVEVTLVH